MDGSVHNHYLTAYVDGELAYTFGGFEFQSQLDAARTMFTAGFKVALSTVIVEYSCNGSLVNVKV